MWEWILQTLDRLCRTDNISNIKGVAEADDVKQEVCLYLAEHLKEAEDIYMNQKTAYLNTIMKRVIYSIKAQTRCRQKKDFSSYQRIQDVCEKYQIPMIEENAYKISHMLEAENYSPEEFTVQSVIRFLQKIHPHEIILVYETGQEKDGGSYD